MHPFSFIKSCVLHFHHITLQSFQDQVRKITEITNKSINLLFLLNISINIHYLCMDGPRGLMFPFYNVF